MIYAEVEKKDSQDECKERDILLTGTFLLLLFAFAKNSSYWENKQLWRIEKVQKIDPISH